MTDRILPLLDALSVVLLAAILLVLLMRLPAEELDTVDPLCPSGSVPFGTTCAVPLPSP